MREIASNVYIEENSLGLVAGLIKNQSGKILIDSPVRNVSGGAWKDSSGRSESERGCYLIVLDSNYDRILSVKGSNCVLVAHSDAISPLRSRVAPPKTNEEMAQLSEPQETMAGLSRMFPPDLNFDTQLSLHLHDLHISLEHHPGSNNAGVWVEIPERKVIFVGDTVVVDQPPFLAYANLQRWEEDLALLSSKRFASYQVVSARSGVVDREQVKQMGKHIIFIRKRFDALKDENAPIEEWYNQIPSISSRIGQLDLFNRELFYNRLHWGITTYYELNRREKG
ncbi:MAG: hypothetical protein GX603_02070 [Chloroflexi bacterium]|mgnify:CR=1 FL=1|nr:hypothetical protein [Chloroflexota bacterium]